MHVANWLIFYDANISWILLSILSNIEPLGGRRPLDYFSQLIFVSKFFCIIYKKPSEVQDSEYIAESSGCNC
jgi:hypothetical protein